MTKILLLAALSSFVVNVSAENVVHVDGKEITYISQVENNKVSTAKMFIGERIIKIDEGNCIQETTRLDSMKVISHKGEKIQAPETTVYLKTVNCPN